MDVLIKHRDVFANILGYVSNAVDIKRMLLTCKDVQFYAHDPYAQALWFIRIHGVEAIWWAAYCLYDGNKSSKSEQAKASLREAIGLILRLSTEADPDHIIHLDIYLCK